MKPSVQRPMNEAHKAILWESFEELAKAVGSRRGTLQLLLLRFEEYVIHGRPLDGAMKCKVIEALK